MEENKMKNNKGKNVKDCVGARVHFFKNGKYKVNYKNWGVYANSEEELTKHLAQIKMIILTKPEELEESSKKI